MAGSINDFKSSFGSDFARANRFDVIINLPLALAFNVPVSARTLRYRCEASQLPGRTLATADRKTYGPVEKVPYISTYNDIDLTFLIEGNMNEKYLFDAWLDYVNPNTTNNFNYKSDYSASIIINQYDVANELTYSVELVDAWPTSINQLDLDWSSDAVHKLNVTFSYTKWINNSPINLFT
jgi:T4-like virus tail tube protein gp19